MAASIIGHSRGPQVFIVTVTTFALATIFVTARLISRFAIVRNRTWDDWFIILAWAIAFGLSFAICYGTSRGLGSRDGDIKSEWLPALRSSEYAFTILYNPALMATKNSILIFYLRMSKNTEKLLRIASYLTLGLVNVAGLVLTFLNAFQCDPVSAAYNPSSTTGRCFNIVTLYLCSAPVNIFANLAILVLPIPVLTGMRLPQRQKTILVLTFALGIFVTIVDVVRIYYLQKAVDNQAQFSEKLGTTSDFAWNASIAFMWSAIEVNVGIICACIPTLKPLIKQILPAMITDRSRNNSATEKTSMSSQISPDAVSNPHQGSTEPLPSIQALPAAHTAADQEREMDFMAFLTTPEDGINRTVTARTAATAATGATENSVYFGFVNMKKPRSMLKLRGRESFKYCAIVTTIFFLWGFSYGLLNTLNNGISNIARQSTAETIGLTTAYFGAYIVGSMTTGQWVLRHSGFKATFITGLCIYGTGTLMFWPSAVLTSFTGFILSNFVVGFGLSVLETAANPFLALCGPSSYSEFRLLMAQAVQGIGSVLSQLLAQKLLLKSVVNKPSLIDVQWTYLAIALFDVVLALFFYYLPLPEATDAALQKLCEDKGIVYKQTVFSPKLRLVYVTLGLAVFAQFCYVGAQESASSWSGKLLISVAKSKGTDLSLSPDDWGLVGHVCFTGARFLFAGLSLVVAPRILLFIATLGCLIFSILIVTLHINANGVAGLTMGFFFFEGPMWPLIFSIGLRGLGKRTKIGAAMLTAGASGGAIFPFVMWAIRRIHGKTVQYSWSVNIALFAFGLLYPAYLTLVPKARNHVNPQGNQFGLPRNEFDDDGSDTPIRRMSRRFSIMFAKIGGGKNSLEDDTMTEHRETSTSSPGVIRGRSGDEDRILGSRQSEMERSPRS